MTTSAPSRPDLRPLVVAGGTAVVSLGLVVAAARWGWMGEDVGRGATFCEAPRAGWIRQPANTWSNLAFVVAGLAVAWYAVDRARLGLTLGAHPGLATAYAVLVVLLGPGSMAMHATQSDLGGHLDLLSMFLVSAFALAYALMRLVHRGPAFLALVFLVAVVAGMAVQLRGGSVPLVGTCRERGVRSPAAGRRRGGGRPRPSPVRAAGRPVGAGEPHRPVGGLRDLDDGPAGPRVVPARLAAPAARRLAHAVRGRGLPPLPALCGRARGGGAGCRPTVGCEGPRPPTVSGVLHCRVCRAQRGASGSTPSGVDRSSPCTSPEMSRSRRSTPVMRWNVAPAITAPRMGASQNTHS